MTTDNNTKAPVNLAKDVQKDHSTNLKFENIELDTGVEDKLFHEMYLKRLPQ